MTFFEEVVISGFIGEAASICVDVSCTKIKEAVKNKRNKHKSIESQIYNVIVNILNQITYNEFENDQNKIYQAAEKLLIGYKDDKCDNLEAMRFCMQILNKSINGDKYTEFKKLLYQEFVKKDYEELYRQIRLIQQDEGSRKSSRIEKKVDKVQESVDEANRRLDAFYEGNIRVDNVQNKKPVKSRTQEYADKWNANMFLNKFDEWDGNADDNVKLSEVYLDAHLPHFIRENKRQVFDNLDVFLSRYILESNENKMLLILGQPGIGKSTLITWIVTKFNEYMDDILVYNFADDLKSLDWQSPDISKRILEALNYSYDDLEGKTLILDGFDEVSIGVDRKEVLDNLYGELIFKKNIERFSLIITCRENYVQGFERIKCKYIILQPWDKMQIKSFCDIFQRITENVVSENTIKKLIENKDILGIPLILYMVLALNISIEKEGSIVDVYDKIFCLEGGIYDRCIDNKMFADKHRIGEIKEYIHQISRDIAIWMFENNPEGASISQKEYIDICKNVMRKPETKNEEINHDFKIGSYFKLIKHCDGVDTEELSLVHRSIYEYLVAETIYNAIENAMLNLTEEGKKEAGNIVMFLKQGHITNTIGDYLQHKIVKLYNRLNTSKKERFYQWWEQAVDQMLKSGFPYFTKENVRVCYGTISMHVICFLNLIKILRLLSDYNERRYIGEYITQKQIARYVWHYIIEHNMGYICDGNTVDLNKMFLKEADLRRANFYEACLRKSNLSGANLSGANLYRTDMREADLSKADLSKTDLRKANLGGTDLRESNMIEANLERACLSKADLRKADLEGADLQNVKFGIADLRNANLSRVNLRGAHIEWADLSHTDLLDAVLDEIQVNYLKGKYNLQGTKVYIDKTGETITYEEYCLSRK